jgi:hypothetical protein
MSWLVGAPSFVRLLIVELWFFFIYGNYNGAMLVALTEIMPLEVRTAGFSLAYSLATAIFGGFTPAMSEYLIHATNNKAAPGVWLMFAACGLLAVLLSASRTHGSGSSTTSGLAWRRFRRQAEPVTLPAASLAMVPAE